MALSETQIRDTESSFNTNKWLNKLVTSAERHALRVVVLSFNWLTNISVPRNSPNVPPNVRIFVTESHTECVSYLLIAQHCCCLIIFGRSQVRF